MTTGDLIAGWIALFSLGGMFGFAFGYVQGYRSRQPCALCGASDFPRSHYGMTETWRCVDRDGCNARQVKRKAL